QNLVTVGATIADFKVPELICEGTPVKFTNTGTPVPANATWDFGDGTTSNAVHPVKVFIAPGTYIVSMVSNNGACKDSVFQEIKVIEKPDVSFFSADTVSCQALFNVGFTDTSITGSNIVNNMVIYHWDFGDGNTSDQKSPSHTYTKEGNFTVKLFVTNIAGCKDSLVIKNYIRIKKPVASINNLPQKGCAPLSHKFTSTISSIDPVVSYHWNFGDGTSSDSITPTHVYNTPGKYTVTLTYTTQSGCVN